MKVRRCLVRWEEWISYTDESGADPGESVEQDFKETARHIVRDHDESWSIVHDTGVIDEESEADPFFGGIAGSLPINITLTRNEWDTIANAVDMGLHDTMESVKGNPQHEEDAETIATLILRFQHILDTLEQNGASW